MVTVTGRICHVKITDRGAHSAFGEAALPAEAEQVLRKFLDGMSSFMINRAEPGSRVLGRCTFYEFKGDFKVRTVPTDRVRGLLAIDILPMTLCINHFSVDNLIMSRLETRRE
jgi:hypothetical protein